MTTTQAIIKHIHKMETEKLQVKPRYVPLQSTLFVADQVVKRFQHPSPNQQVILYSFQELG